MRERKSLKKGDVELLKRVIRSNEGTFTGYIRDLEGIEAPEVKEETTPEFQPFMQSNEVSSAVETTSTLN